MILYYEINRKNMSFTITRRNYNKYCYAILLDTCYHINGFYVERHIVWVLYCCYKTEYLNNVFINTINYCIQKWVCQ